MLQINSSQPNVAYMHHENQLSFLVLWEYIPVSEPQGLNKLWLKCMIKWSW